MTKALCLNCRKEINQNRLLSLLIGDLNYFCDIYCLKAYYLLINRKAESSIRAKKTRIIEVPDGTEK